MPVTWKLDDLHFPTFRLSSIKYDFPHDFTAARSIQEWLYTLDGDEHLFYLFLGTFAIADINNFVFVYTKLFWTESFLCGECHDNLLSRI